jgi:hypothetical protein
MSLSINRIKELITKHDLTYTYSDDNTVYKRGLAQYELIKNAIDNFDLRTTHGKDAKDILTNHWNNKVELELTEDVWSQFKWEKPMNTEEKKTILENKGNTGQKYCNAIDEDINDSSTWENSMPASGYRFYTKEETGQVEVYHENYFACYDGWDSSVYDSGIYANMKEAVDSIWQEEQGLLRDDHILDQGYGMNETNGFGHDGE